MLGKREVVIACDKVFSGQLPSDLTVAAMRVSDASASPYVLISLKGRR